MSDLTLFVLETDLKDLSTKHLNKIEEVLLRSQNSAVQQIEDITSALKVLNDARQSRGDDGPTTKKSPQPK